MRGGRMDSYALVMPLIFLIIFLADLFWHFFKFIKKIIFNSYEEESSLMIYLLDESYFSFQSLIGNNSRKMFYFLVR